MVAWVLQPYMDVVLIAGDNTGSSYFPLLIVIFAVIQSLLSYGSNYLNTWVGQKVSMDVKAELFRRLVRSDPVFFDRSTSGDVLLRYNNDVDAACSSFLANAKFVIVRTVSSISLIGVLFWNSAILASLSVFLLLVCLYPLTRVRRRLRGIFSQATFAGSSLLTCYNEAFGGNRVIAAYNIQEYMVDRLKSTLAGQFRLGIKMVQRTCGLSLFTHAIVAVGIASTLMLQGYLISRGLLTPGRFVAFIAALLMLYTPLKGIGGNFQSLQFSIMALERVLEKLDEQPRIRNRPGAVPAAGFSRSIVYENVEFSYIPDRPVIRNVSLEIEKGRTIAFVGGSGGGKTTLVSLLPRFYDVSAGRILLDGTDVRDIELTSLRNLVSMVFQDNFLFAGSVRDNILLGDRSASEDDLRGALEAACLWEFADSLPRGLDTEIGERGILLSGGQKQRLAIARAFIKKSPIVILDEATSALDNQSEAVVQRAIDNLMRDKTIFVVAHRLSTVINADVIVVVENGGIVERGAHGELMRLPGGRYRSLYENQLC